MSNQPTITWGEALSKATTRLIEAGIDTARLDARLLLAHHVNTDAAMLLAFPEREVDDYEAFQDLINRRAQSEPVSHLIGTREFWSLPFKVNQHVLDPRPDSETLIEAVLQRLPDQEAAYNFIDFGTGTGCLPLTLLSEYKNARAVAVDISPDALNVAKENAETLNLANRCDFIHSDWAENIAGKYDLLISNPPYITSKDMKTLSRDVYEYEPHLALHGGADGLLPYHKLIPAGRKLLNNGGLICLEFGYDQADAVRELLANHGYTNIQAHPDLSGIIRCLTAISAK